MKVLTTYVETAKEKECKLYFARVARSVTRLISRGAQG